jgi:hypothetical protein
MADLITQTAVRPGGRTLVQSVEHIDQSLLPKHVEDIRLDLRRTAGSAVLGFINTIKNRVKLEQEATVYTPGFQAAARPAPAVEVLSLMNSIRRFRESLEFARYRSIIVASVRRQRDAARSTLELLESDQKSGHAVYVGADSQTRYARRREGLVNALQSLEARVERLDPSGSDERRAEEVKRLLGDPGELVETMATHIRVPRVELDRALEAPDLRLPQDSQRYRMAKARLERAEANDLAARERIASGLVEAAMGGTLHAILDLAEELAAIGGRSAALVGLAGSEAEFLALIADIYEHGI